MEVYDEEFLKKFRERPKSGCRFCTGNCLERLAKHEASILKLRQAFRGMSKDAQDRDLLWVFARATFSDEFQDEDSKDPDVASEQHTSPEALSDDEQTSRSGGDMEQPLDANIHADTSSSDSGDMHPEDEAAAESTSSSSELLRLDEPTKGRGAAKSSTRPYVKKRRLTRRSRSVPVQGFLPAMTKPFLICRKTAEFCIGVGPNRVQRVLHGYPDRRRKGYRVPCNHESLTSRPQAICVRFLWRKYHFDAEGLPDKFSFERRGATSLTISAMGNPNDLDRDIKPERSADMVLDEEERAIADCALHMASAHEPNIAANMGPGMKWGPTRYLGVMKPVHLYLELQSWCDTQNIPKPSFSTFLRSLHGCASLRFRKVVGQHPNCDICTKYKGALRSAANPCERANVLDDYCRHLLKQWLDRGVDGNFTELSRQCRRMLEMGQRLISLARQHSVWFIRIDGVDQAKFRVPRVKVKTHSFDKLIRPALHVQGAWCEGFAFHFAIADADMKKDTNNNIEVLARLMNQLYQKWGALPLTLSFIMDNTSRECKNQKMVKFATRLVALNLVENVILNYPMKGHTHGPLDATFGQMCVKLSLSEFDDDLNVVEILDGFLRESGLDAATRSGSKAYKLDEAFRAV